MDRYEDDVLWGSESFRGISFKLLIYVCEVFSGSWSHVGLCLQMVNLQKALLHQVIGPCKPCSDPNLSVAEKGDHFTTPPAPSTHTHLLLLLLLLVLYNPTFLFLSPILLSSSSHFSLFLLTSLPSPTAVLTTPSSWSLDSGTKDVLPFLSVAPPVPPRNLSHGRTLPLVVVWICVCVCVSVAEPTTTTTKNHNCPFKRIPLTRLLCLPL